VKPTVGEKVLGNSEVVERIVVVRNRNGLHARPSSVLAETALRFTDTELLLRRESEGEQAPSEGTAASSGGAGSGSAGSGSTGSGRTEVDAKSIMELLLLAAGPGTRLTLIANGPSAEEAIETLAGLFEREFDLDL
jgi:phosphocarrier protein